jgi:hypothetical protein
MCQGNKHKFILVFHGICGFEDMTAATSVMLDGREGMELEMSLEYVLFCSMTSRLPHVPGEQA